MFLPFLQNPIYGVESRSREKTAYLTEKRCSRESSGTLFGYPRWASLAMGLKILDPQHSPKGNKDLTLSQKILVY